MMESQMADEEKEDAPKSKQVLPDQDFLSSISFGSLSQDEELKGVAKLVQQAAEQQWTKPKSGTLAAVEFDSWAKEHAHEDVMAVIAHVKEFVEALGGSWEKIDERPKNETERQQYETVCLYAMTVWRMRQLHDLQPRILKAMDKLTELQGPGQDMQQAHLLMHRLLQGVAGNPALPETPHKEPGEEAAKSPADES
jgi:hypothetical protein